MHVPRRFARSLFSAFTRLALTLLLGTAISGCSHGGPLENGLYLRTHFSSSTFLWAEFLYVSGDRICWNAKGGVDPFDFNAAEQNDPKNVGHYKINGDQIEVAWGGGRGTAKWKLELQNGKVSAIDFGGIVKATPYPKNAHLEASFDGKLGPKDSNGYPKPATLSFTKDGHCNLFASGTVMYGGKVLKQEADYNQSGTYELSGNTLTLHYADGKTERHTVMPWNKAADPAHAKLSDEQLVFDAMFLSRSH